MNRKSLLIEVGRNLEKPASWKNAIAMAGSIGFLPEDDSTLTEASCRKALDEAMQAALIELRCDRRRPFSFQAVFGRRGFWEFAILVRLPKVNRPETFATVIARLMSSHGASVHLKPMEDGSKVAAMMNLTALLVDSRSDPAGDRPRRFSGSEEFWQKVADHERRMKAAATTPTTTERRS